MKSIQKNLLNLVLVSVLSAIVVSFVSFTALAQTDISINNNNLIRIGGDVTIPPEQKVENAHAIGGDVTIGEGARVTKTAIAVDGDVILEKGARVDGDVYAVGGKIIVAPGATIGGTSGTALDGRWGTYGYRRRGGNFFRYLFHTGFHIFNVVAVTILGVLLLLWRPNILLNLATTVREYPLQCGLWGNGGLLAVILLIIFLAISLIGIPLLPVVGLAVTIAVVLGNLGVALLLGQRILSGRERTTMQEFLVGMLVLGLIGLVPVLGGLVSSVVNIFGLGALITWLLNKRRIQPVV
ncbi:MAG: polymer-forming cytoskeletal protein [Calothrix sp. C42_A2020_038]|nr:polymer-forming cytoskeletal protein [Calothrix sp. C42_A2020_038]